MMFNCFLSIRILLSAVFLLSEMVRSKFPKKNFFFKNFFLAVLGVFDFSDVKKRVQKVQKRTNQSKKLGRNFDLE